MGNSLSKMKKQTQKLHSQLEKMQSAMRDLEGEGQSGNGLVVAKVNGEKDLISLKINPECVDKEDIEGLEDLVMSAVQNAQKNLTEKMPNMPIDGLGI